MSCDWKAIMTAKIEKQRLIIFQVILMHPIVNLLLQLLASDFGFERKEDILVKKLKLFS